MPGLDTVFAYSLQVACLAALALLLPWAVRLADPRVAYVYWRGALVISLVAPFVGLVWRPASTGVAGVTGAVEFVASAVGVGPVLGSSVDFRWLLAAGVAAMVVWRGLGFLRLGGYRRRARQVSGEELPPAPRIEAALGVHPEYFLTDEVSGPLTFGLLRQSILLPRRLSGLGGDEMESVLTHEMIHVRNRDWPQVLAEEALRCLLWFHPLVHWLIDRVRSSREMSVDAATVRMMGDRERSLVTLVQIAEKQRQPTWIAAPLFGGSRLKQRVEVLLEDHTMSKLRIVLVALLAFAAFSIGGRFANEAFPLAAFAAENYTVYSVGDDGVTRPKLIRKVEPNYTDEAREADLQGTVWLELEVHLDGRAHNVQIAEGLGMGLDEEAVAAVEQWTFAPAEKDGEPVVVAARIQVTFRLL